MDSAEYRSGFYDENGVVIPRRAQSPTDMTHLLADGLRGVEMACAMAAQLKVMADIQSTLSGRDQFKFTSYEDFLLRKGRWFRPANAGERHLDVGKLGDCYKNATLAVMSDDTRMSRHAGNVQAPVKYCEGYAMSPRCPIPIMHAWVTLGDRAYDVTWPWDSDKEEGAYFGISVRTPWFVETLYDLGHYGLFCNDYRNNFKILRQGIPETAISWL